MWGTGSKYPLLGINSGFTLPVHIKQGLGPSVTGLLWKPLEGPEFTNFPLALRVLRAQDPGCGYAGPSLSPSRGSAGARRPLCPPPSPVPGQCGAPSRRARAPGAPLALVTGRAKLGRAATPRAAGWRPRAGEHGRGRGAGGAGRSGPGPGRGGGGKGARRRGKGRRGGDGTRGARTWRPARGRGQGRLLRRAAAPRAGTAASMAPSPRTSSRQDATALPSMSSTFWAFMILASLLIAYCSEYRAPGPHSGLGSPARSLPRRGAPRRCRVASAWARGPGSWPVLRWPARAGCRRLRIPGTPLPGASARACFRGLASRAGVRPRPAGVSTARRAVATLAQAGDRAELRALSFPPATLPQGTCGDAAAEPERYSSGRSAAWVPTRGGASAFLRSGLARCFL